MNISKNRVGIIAGFLGVIILLVGGFFFLNNNSSNQDINFSLLGDEQVEITSGNYFDDPGFTAYDKKGNDITSSIIVENNVDINAPGIYIIKYRLDGKLLAEREVKVVKSNSSKSNDNSENNKSNNSNDKSTNTNNNTNNDNNTSNDNDKKDDKTDNNKTDTKKTNDKITITAKSVTYTGKAIEADIKANTAIKEKVYYSDSSCKTKTTTKNATVAGGAPKAVGTYYVKVVTKGDSKYNSASSGCKKAVQINHIIIKFDKTVINITEDSKVTLNIAPKGTKVTYSSNNTKVATVNSSGVVEGKMAGSVKINAKSLSGYNAEITIVVLAKKPYKDPISYSSSTFKYWMQYFNIKSGNRQKRYVLTNIWMADPYNQIRVAHPSKSMSPLEIINGEIKTYGLQSKGLIAMNASVTTGSGLPGIPLVLDTGKDGKTKVLKNTGKTSVYTIYGVTKDGYLKTYKANSTLKDRALADGLKYTFGFYPVLVNNYKYDADSVAARLKAEGDTDVPNIRLAVCQIDKNNFVIITSWNFTTDLSDRRTYGLTHKELGDMMVALKCKTGINLDGGSSVTYMYKKSTNNISYIRKSAKPDRPDILYFTEK